jgi:hypothetical protein
MRAWLPKKEAPDGGCQGFFHCREPALMRSVDLDGRRQTAPRPPAKFSLSFGLRASAPGEARTLHPRGPGLLQGRCTPMESV